MNIKFLNFEGFLLVVYDAAFLKINRYKCI